MGEFIECPSEFKTGPMKLRMKGGSSKYWHAFQPENHKNKVTSMSINGVEMIFGDIDGFWWKGAGIMEFPAKVTMNNEDGECASITMNGLWMENVKNKKSRFIFLCFCLRVG